MLSHVYLQYQPKLRELAIYAVAVLEILEQKLLHHVPEFIKAVRQCLDVSRKREKGICHECAEHLLCTANLSPSAGY